MNKLIRFPFRRFVEGRYTLYFEIAYILLLPIAVWFLYRFSTFNNNDGLLDSWIYFSYVNNFQDLIDRYGLPYYSVRFGLIFPLIVFVKIFGSVNGYLAFVYSMYLLAGVSLYLLFRKLFSVHAAVLAYTILVSSVWFARTVLWTHPDAAAVPYLIAAIALILLEPKYKRPCNFIIGILIALAVNSSFFALSIGGLSGVAYLVYYKNTLWTRLRQDLPWLISGFFLVFAAGSIGFNECCNTYNYFTTTLGMIKWSNSGAGVVYKVPIANLLKISYLYLVPFIIASLVIVLRWANVTNPRLLFAATGYLVATTAFFVWYEFAIPAALLELFYYFSFFLAPSIVCIVLVPVLLAKESNSSYLSLNLAIASFLVPPLLFTYGIINLNKVPIYAVWTGIALTLLLLLATSKSKKIIPYAILSFGLVFHLFWSSSQIIGKPTYAGMYGKLNEVGMSRYRLGLKFIEVMPKFRDEGMPIHFWYSNYDQLANSLQSTYLWGYSRIMGSDEDIDGLPSLNGVNKDLLYKRSNLVLFDRDENNVNKGIKELQSLDVEFRISRTRKICEEDICYTIAVLDVGGGSAKFDNVMYRPLNVSLDWSNPGADANITREGSIIYIITHPKAWNYAALAKMVFSDQSSYQEGVVRVLVSVTEANVGIGFTGTNHSNFIKRFEILPKNEPQELFFEFDNLSELHKLVISTWDQDKSAIVQILEFSVRGL